MVYSKREKFARLRVDISSEGICRAEKQMKKSQKLSPLFEMMENLPSVLLATVYADEYDLGLHCLLISISPIF